MKYYSTKNKNLLVDFKEATIKGQPEDKGLYFPEKVPQLPPDFLDRIDTYTKEEIAYTIIAPYVGDSIPPDVLRRIVEETINFPFPLKKINENIFSLELYHGPTLAFKDVGARFMSRCLSFFLQNNTREVTVLVATSGDTGGAVANGFYNVEGIRVVILYPSGKVSSIQEKQLTTLGKNVSAIEVDGSFDDCQHMVKEAFADKELNKNTFLTSANSINVARWLPQQFYYFFAYQQWQDKKHPPVVSVPSGNFGNICAGLIASISGLPVRHFIAACNANDAVPDYLKKGIYHPKPSIATISNAMDVGDPSNFVRMLELFNHKYESIRTTISSYSINDEETKQTIKEVKRSSNYILDPHGAVAYAALKHYLKEHDNEKGFILETAHPIKFYDVMEKIIAEPVDMPASVGNLLHLEKKSIKMKADYQFLKEYLKERHP